MLFILRRAPPPGLAKTGYKFKSKDLVRFNFTSLEYIGLFRVLSAAALNRLYIAPTKNRELNLLILSDEIETHHPQGFLPFRIPYYTFMLF